MAFDKSWDKLHTEREWGVLPDLAMMNFYEAHFKDTAGLTFVDLGCAVGAQTFFLASNSHTVYAVDAAQPAIDRLENKLTDYNVIPICQDVADFSLPEQTVDCVIEVALFEQITFEDALKVMANAKKYLKKGGRFFARIATEPWPSTFHRSDYHRRSSLKDVDEMFKGFDRKISLIQLSRPNTSDFQSYHYVVDAQLMDQA